MVAPFSQNDLVYTDIYKYREILDVKAILNDLKVNTLVNRITKVEPKTDIDAGPAEDGGPPGIPDAQTPKYLVKRTLLHY